jgi:hypothetical protein
MSYTLPTFNLSVNIWRYPSYPGVPTLTAMGNLAYSRRTASDLVGPLPVTPTYCYARVMSLLLPRLTDIRDAASEADGDLVEVPAGSGRVYQVTYVDDIGKGFANEHRIALLYKYPLWPAPIP